MNKWIFIFFIHVLSTIILADGMAFKSGIDRTSYIPVTEENQQAIIAHKDGREAMLLAVNFNLDDKEKAFWLFPVPGQPEEINTDILGEYPRIRGLEYDTKAQATFASLFGIQLLSQPYIWPFICCMMPALGKAGLDYSDFNVYSIAEKYGLRIEVLTSESTNALAHYLQEKEVNVDAAHLETFNDYLNGQYSLIFVEISSKEELLEQFPDYERFQRGKEGRWPSVFVEFPADKIFYPLKPTSAYKDSIRIIVKVLGYVKNQQALNNTWTCGYYRQIQTGESLPTAFQSYMSEEPLVYTSLYFDGNANELTDDLWMEPFQPKNIRYAQFVDNLSKIGGGSVIIIIGVILFLVQSWLCAGLTGLIFFRKWYPYAF